MTHVIEGVEICTAGMDWPASTGPATVTMENIADAIVAANEDPHIQVPRGRVGHTSALNEGIPKNDPFAPIGDGEPAFGRFINLRTANDGAVLIGDAIDVPDWINAGTYPSRSMECSWDVTTPGGKRYSMVVTAVAWLGPYCPAVQDLEDLVSLLAQGPDALPAAQPTEATVPAAELSVSASVIRDRFNFDWTMGEPVDGLDTYWWWARDIRYDPAEIIADDDEGGLWRVPFSTDGEDAVTFGEPVRVRETYVDVAPTAASAADRFRRVFVDHAGTPAAMAVSVMERQQQQVLATFTERPSKPQPNTNPAAASAGPDSEEHTMEDAVRQVLERQGLDPDTASEAQRNAAEVLAGTEPAETEPTAEAEPELETELEPVAATRAVTVDRGQFEQMQADAAAGREARNQQVASDRDALVTAAVADGRIAPSSREAWREALDARPEAEAAALAALTPGRIPVDERGSAPSDNETGVTATGLDVSLCTPQQRASLAARGLIPAEA